MLCFNCGQEMNDGTKKCPNCGQKQTEASSVTAPQPSAIGAPTKKAKKKAAQDSASSDARANKKRGCLPALIIIILGLTVSILSVYFLLPGMQKPVDLGLKASVTGYTSAMEKLGVTKDLAPTGSKASDYKTIFGAPHDVDTSLTSEELTSFFNVNRPFYYAIKNVQVRINADGSIEASAKLTTSYVFDQMFNGQYTPEDAKAALPKLGLLPARANIYFKAFCTIEDNQIQQLAILSAQVMGIDITASISDATIAFITETLNAYIASECAKAGAYIDYLGTQNEMLTFVGTVPSTIERINVNQD